MSFHKYSCFNKYKTLYVTVFFNSLYKCNKHKVMSHILKLANTDVTYSLQPLYSIVIVYVIEFYSIHCTNVMITNKCLILQNLKTQTLHIIHSFKNRKKPIIHSFKNRKNPQRAIIISFKFILQIMTRVCLYSVCN